MDTSLKIALVLSAFDTSGGVFDKFFNKTGAGFEKMKAAQKSIKEGFYMMAAGEKGFEFLAPAVAAFGDLEEAQNDLKTSMMTKGGILDQSTFAKVNNM